MMHGVIAPLLPVLFSTLPIIILSDTAVITTIEKPDSTTSMRDTIILNGVDLFLLIVPSILIPKHLTDLTFMLTAIMIL